MHWIQEKRMHMLNIHNLHLTIGNATILQNVSLALTPGETLALVGESGSGKSLTALSVMQLLPDKAMCSGSIMFEERELINAPQALMRTLRGNDIGMIFQEPMMALNPLHTIGKQLHECLEIHPQQIKDPALLTTQTHRISTLLEHVGLPHMKDRLGAYPHQLSGGERQRVMIAMAIANNPKLLIADEPTTALDVTVQATILKLLKQLQQTHGLAILFITHDLALVKRFADRVAVMKDGHVVECGDVAKLVASPKHSYTRNLLHAIPATYPEPIQGTPSPLLDVQRLKVHFPIKRGLLKRTVNFVKAVDEVSFSLRKAETCGIVGESGSGKTTLGMAVLRLCKSEGTIVYAGNFIDGLNTHAMRPLRREMQLVFQDPFGSLNPRMTAEQIIAEGLQVHAQELTKDEREQRVAAILKEVGLTPEMKTRYPHAFSGGQRQRIGIARAMILRPKIVVLDEPTSALDVTTQAQIIALLQRFQKDYGVSYLFITHDLRVVRAMAHRIIVMREGQIVENGEARQIIEAPSKSYTKALIEAAML